MLLKYYSGIERRSYQRRHMPDRRDCLRWGVEGEERRARTNGRRKLDNAKSMWHQ
ncbi:MAG: hypothetical protein ACTHY5_01745 [Oceanisphaera sp.]|uniref:hypothetical protein n=1 Tax=Oceanisphaera sp. TaxID=1929979 RepID=UPI003F9D8747